VPIEEEEEYHKVTSKRDGILFFNITQTLSGSIKYAA
jgi:hypothetical protein